MSRLLRPTPTGVRDPRRADCDGTQRGSSGLWTVSLTDLTDGPPEDKAGQGPAVYSAARKSEEAA